MAYYNPYITRQYNPLFAANWVLISTAQLGSASICQDEKLVVICMGLLGLYLPLWLGYTVDGKNPGSPPGMVLKPCK